MDTTAWSIRGGCDGYLPLFNPFLLIIIGMTNEGVAVSGGYVYYRCDTATPPEWIGVG